MLRFFINQDDKKTFVISGLTLTTLIFLAGLSVYTVMQRQIEAMTAAGLEATLENTVKLIENEITHSVANTRAISTRIFLIQSLEKVYSNDSRSEGIAGLQESAKKILTTHFSGISIYDTEDNLLLTAGTISKHATLPVELNTHSEVHTLLFWNQGFVLQNSLRIFNKNNQLVGRITTEEQLSGLTRIFTDTPLVGKTGDFLLCAPAANSDLEMDCFLRAFDGNQFKRVSRVINNKPLPIHFALNGETGTKLLKDYRQVDVVAAHAPVAYGLGAALKIDKNELNNYFTHQVKIIITYLTLILLFGIAVIHWMTMPFIQRSIKQKESYLNERLKENICLEKIRNYLAQDQCIEETCKNILSFLLSVFETQEMVVAKISLENKQITTPGYRENLPNTIEAAIIANGQQCGSLQLAFMHEVPHGLVYQKNLIGTIVHDLGRWYERKEAEKRIIEMATHDALTGLPNRNLLQDRVEQVLVHDTRRQRQMAVLFIDLDRFKTINDSLGHDIGDLLLKAVANRLKFCVRTEDTVARQGGDEFIVVLNSIAESLDAAKVAQKILDSLIQPFYIHGNELHIGGSIGIAVFPNDGSTAETLLRNSDVAMYHAKENGRNNYQFFTDELNKSAYERHTLSLDLRYAMERNELILHYQPVMDMPNHHLYGLEALLRWRHPVHQLISPDKFINLAEETGLIIPIGEWVLKTVCVQIKAWQNQGYYVPRIAINLSARQFRDKDLITNIAQILRETGVDAKYISLEITESMLIDNIEKVVETLSSLHAMGLHISIDDFGTGYSSLSYLKKFPIHTLKIDRSFVRDIVTDKNDRTIVAAIIAMAHSLELDVIAEGIEIEEQLAFLTEQKCNHYQGYYFSKPVPALEIENMLKPVLQKTKIRAIHSIM
ncbi:putative bifunctional diguanylate cyclase/phosphodiesterase [Nitrosomonas sp.]|uniref:putative bifunctional diguanylate cyclase/phosphodiesterase n=1 Tax=Nitrosomonas sp. TaxID=42353 RepID=UPI001D392487|nr:EAL domain-containing protein [Nitrosomonas sp.]MBX3616653.1 EAL domain-containing protein [Nitrosomonas sp.]